MSRHMSSTRALLLGVAALAAIAAPSVASADASPSTADRAAAQALFDEGRALVAKKQFAEACPKFADSQRLDPKGGTLLNLAACNEELGKVATAWTQFNEALSIAIRDGRADRVAAAKKHIAAIEPKLARLTVRVAEPSVEGLAITLDGEPLARAAWGTAAPIDPGEHTVDAKAPKRLPFHGVVRVEASDAQIEVPALAEDPDAKKPEVTPPPPPPPPPPPAAPPPPDATGRHVLGGVVLGVGVIGIGIGSYFGLQSIAKWHDARGACPNDACSAQGESYIGDSRTAAHIADVAFGAGIVAAGIGAYFLLTSPSASTPTTSGLRVTPVARGGAISWDGTW